MNFALTEDQEMLRDEIVHFARQELNKDIIERDRNQEFPRDLWLKCGEMGLQGLPVPEEYGGAGLDALSTAIAIEALGYGCEDGGLSFSICAHLLACVIPIMNHGTEEQKRKYLPKLCSGELIAVNAMSEPGTGSDAFNMKTRAIREEGGYRINGTKIWSTNGPVADIALLYAVTDPDKGISGSTSAFIVERETPGFSPGQKFEKMGLRTSPIGEMVFEDMFVPESALLGGEGAGFVLFNQSMEWERVCIGAKHCGTMRRLMEKSVSYSKERESFGQPISKYEAVSNKIADMKMRLEGARLLTYQGATRLDKARDVAIDASMTKIFVSESLVQTALDTVQIYGGNGFTTDYEVERTLRDSIGGKIYSGTNEIQKKILGNWLGL